MTYNNGDLRCDADGYKAIYSDGKWVSAGRRHLLNWATSHGFDGNGCQFTMHYVPDNWTPCEDLKNEHVKALKVELDDWRKLRQLKEKFAIAEKRVSEELDVEAIAE